jgi:hypothetical protein
LVEQHRWVSRAAPEVWSDHRVSDIRSLALHALIARKVVEDSSAIVRARENLERWAASQGATELWMEEWRRILDRPAEQVALFLVSVSDDAFRLRQSSPFAGVLPAEERRALWDAFRERA